MTDPEKVQVRAMCQRLKQMLEDEDDRHVVHEVSLAINMLSRVSGLRFTGRMRRDMMIRSSQNFERRQSRG